MTTTQIKSYNEMGQLLMSKLDITSKEASEMINKLMQDFLNELNNGILK